MHWRYGLEGGLAMMTTKSADFPAFSLTHDLSKGGMKTRNRDGYYLDKRKAFPFNSSYRPASKFNAESASVSVRIDCIQTANWPQLSARTLGVEVPLDDLVGKSLS